MLSIQRHLEGRWTVLARRELPLPDDPDQWLALQLEWTATTAVLRCLGTEVRPEAAISVQGRLVLVAGNREPQPVAVLFRGFVPPE